MSALFQVHKPGRLIELSRNESGRYRVTAYGVRDWQVVTADAQRLVDNNDLDAEGAIEALAAVLARKTRRTRNGAQP
jgi:hypothetical protein